MADGTGHGGREHNAAVHTPTCRTESFAPLFTERAQLPPDDPRRETLRAHLINGHLPVAKRIARRYAHDSETSQDLEQVAALGLVLAVDRFAPDRGTDFLSYAVPTITGELMRHLRDRSRVIRLPRRVTQLRATVMRATASMAQELGRSPRPQEIATRLEIPVADVVDGLGASDAGRCVSLDGPLSQARIVGESRQIDPALALVEARDVLGPLLRTLTDRDRRIVVMRFFGEMTQCEIAREFGLSQVQVSRLLSATLRKMGRTLRAAPTPADTRS